jgi:hypothetical protein
MNYNDLYNQRYDKIMDTVAFKNKSVTTIYMGQATPAAEEGLTLAEFLSSPDVGLKHTLHYVNRLNRLAPIDGVNSTHAACTNVSLSTLWWSYVKMPGRELPDNSVWQVDEKEQLKVEDYDFILENGMDAMFQKLMPKLFSQEDWQNFLEYAKNAPQDIQAYIDAGYPIMRPAPTATNPFETLCGGRGMHNFFMDCYKMPDKIKAVQDKMMESIRKKTAQISPEKAMIGAWVGGWRGASNIVNQKIWDKLVWPYMKELAEILISKGKVPSMHLDSCWDRDIERFKELPEKTVVLNTDGMTDLRRAKKLLGDHAAFMGDVPVQMLAISSKEEVADYTKRLIDDLGPQGLFLCPGCDAPATAKFENMAAMYETAHKYQ